jgi:CubicO group peptidase (beta-lactamase class C family)
MMQKNNPFTPATTPESVGIPSEAILRFLDFIEQERVCLHGFLLVRNNQVACEGYWSPFSPDRLHRMYSVSKSFVSLAVGLMIDEGRLSLDDPVIRFFPDKAPPRPHRWMAQATVQDLLMMATPHSENAYTVHDPDWASCFLNKEPSHPPGTLFAYDTAATVILNTIVERVSQTSFLDYMRPRLLDPIGFSPDAWCVKTPEGSSWGGSGVQCTLRDMAKVALVCLNKGRWGQHQLISSDYISAATSRQIDNTIQGDHGYGYQIWCEKNNGFSFRGMGSQLALCFPDKNFIFACMADTQGSGPTGTGIYEPFWSILYPALSASCEDNPEAFQALNKRLSTLTVLPVKGASTSPIACTIDDQWFTLEKNPMEIKRMKLNFLRNSVIWTYVNKQGQNTLRFGVGSCISGLFPQKNYFGRQIGKRPGKPYECLASAAWVEPHKLNAIVRITDDYLGTLSMSMAFKGQEIAIYMTKTAEWFLDEYQGFAGGCIDS